MIIDSFQPSGKPAWLEEGRAEWGCAVWRSLSPDPNLVLHIHAAQPYWEAMTRDALVDA
ncbi:MAG: hypothetical protein HY704_02615 [Gemmatimonadetes bacterium]|nr:hypothetical protein [Gemmatimonadota bacterium]